MKKKLMILLFTSLMILIFITPIYSWDWEERPSSSGQWITQEDNFAEPDTDEYIYTLYKVSVPSTGYLKIDTRPEDAEVYLWDYSDFYRGRPRKVKNGGKYGVDEGTYHIFAEYNGHKFKYTFKAAPAGSNYNRSRAALLEKNKHKYIAQTPINNYTRWYKINLKKETTASEIRYSSESALAPGTYYISVLKCKKSSSDNYDYHLGGDFYWK